jgi:cellulose synthase (UDP-forming)
LYSTVQSCCGQNYPNFSVILCDDAQPLRPEVRELAASFGCTYVGKNNNAEKKAGNLNVALPLLGDTQYVAVVDAGDTLMPGFLSALVEILEQDSGLAFVQALTEPGNVDAIQEALGVHYVPASSHLRRQAIVTVFGSQHQHCCGSAFVIRVTALEQIGGFPSKCLSDDVYLSLLLHEKGWRSIRPSGVLAKAPYAAGLVNLLKQFERWTMGILQILMIPQTWSGKFSVRPRAKIVMSALLQLYECLGLVPLILPLLFLIAGPKASVPALIGTIVVTMGLRFLAGAFRRRSFWWETIYSTIAAFSLAKALVRFVFDPWGQPFRVTEKSSVNALDGAGGRALLQPLFVYWTIYMLALLMYFNGQADAIWQHASYTFLLMVWVAYNLTAVGHSVYICRLATRRALADKCTTEAHV